MEKGQEKKIENHILNVEVSSKTCVSDKGKDIKPSIEDTNCNLTILQSKDSLILDQINLIQACETKLSGLTLNGPKRLLNGVECEKIISQNINRCTVDNFSLNDSSSHCKTCVNASDNPCESSLDKIDVSDTHQSQESASKPSTLPSDTTDIGIPSLNDVPKENLLNNCNLESINEPNTNGQNVVSSKEQLATSTGQNSGASGSLAEHLNPVNNDVSYVSYQSEIQMPDIMRLIQRDLSEPYSIYTYRYFIHNWPQLCFLAMDGSTCVGAIVCKLDVHRKVFKRGYIAMLAVDEKYRKRKIGSNLVLKAIRAMVADGADEVVLETEITNKPALRLYENLGFVRDKRLFRYYLNGVDALRLKLWLR